MLNVRKLGDLAITTVLLSSRSVDVTHLQSALQERLPPVFVEKICSAKQRAEDIAVAVIRRHFQYVFWPTLRDTGEKDNECPICFGHVDRILIAPHFLFDKFETRLLELHMCAEQELTMRCAAFVHGWFFPNDVIVIVL